jgi:hypothetical protein
MRTSVAQLGVQFDSMRRDACLARQIVQQAPLLRRPPFRRSARTEQQLPDGFALICEVDQPGSSPSEALRLHVNKVGR